MENLRYLNNGIHTQITDIFPRKDYLVLCYVSYSYDTMIPRKVFYFSEPFQYFYMKWIYCFTNTKSPISPF